MPGSNFKRSHSHWQNHHITLSLERLTVSDLGNKGKNAGSKAGDAQPAAPVVDKDELREIRKKTEKGQKSDAIVITQSELERMKAATKIQTKEQESQHRKLLEE